MTTYLIRRGCYSILTLLCMACLTYGMLSITPNGPLDALLARSTSDADRLDDGAIERIMKEFELDLNWLPRFTRWLIGHPRGSIVIGGNELFAAVPIGCLEFLPPGQEAVLTYPDGRVERSDCAKLEYLRDLEGRYVGNGILRFDFGRSQVIAVNRPVSYLLDATVGPTLLLSAISTALALLISVPIGIYTAYRQYSKFDYAVTTVTFFGASLPSLFWGVMFVLIFALGFKEFGLPHFPTGGMESVTDQTLPFLGVVQAGSLADRIWHLALPVGVLTFISLAGWARYIRSSMLEVLQADYVRTARAKGAREWMVLFRHAVRNALIPFVTLIVGILPGLFAGALITESVFSWPGLGRLFNASLFANDYPVAMAIFWIGAVLTLAAFLLADVLYTVVDPRIRLR